MNKKFVKFVTDFGPLLVFLLIYYNSDKNLKIAIPPFIVATIIALIIVWVLEKKIPMVPLIGGILITLFGGLTIYFDNPVFIYIKPTIINILFGLALLFGKYFTNEPVLKKILGNALPLSDEGWLKLNSFTSPPANILNYQRFSVRVEEQTELLKIDEFSQQPNGLLVHFSGYDDPDSSKKLVGQQLSVESACLPELQNNDFYWHELENLEVVNQDGHNLGKVAYLIETGANDVLVVQPTTVSLDGRERLIPYVKGSVIKNVDLENYLEKIIRDKSNEMQLSK